MSENKYLADMIDIVSPLPERREEAWLILQRKIELMRSRMAHLTAKKRAFDLSPAKHRDALKRLSRTLSKAAWQARGLGPDNALMRSSLEDALKIEDETLSLNLSDHLEICRQTVDDFTERVIVWKGSQPGAPSRRLPWRPAFSRRSSGGFSTTHPCPYRASAMRGRLWMLCARRCRWYVTHWRADIQPRASAMRRFPSLQTLRAELTLCARRRHSAVLSAHGFLRRSSLDFPVGRIPVERRLAAILASDVVGKRCSPMTPQNVIPFVAPQLRSGSDRQTLISDRFGKCWMKWKSWRRSGRSPG